MKNTTHSIIGWYAGLVAGMIIGVSKNIIKLGIGLGVGIYFYSNPKYIETVFLLGLSSLFSAKYSKRKSVSYLWGDGNWQEVIS